ncbi:tetratricopeptide repeat protein [Solibacillus ferritrahens]|uniref:tetratricopeptide repeat protein n=1 Tax=Solibacillus ferritrahens TaxID=3098620 RepID=UPI0030093D11
MQFTESTRKYILIGFVAFIIVGFISAKVLGSKQDEEFLVDDTLYQQANQLYNEGNYPAAGELIDDLLLRQPNSEIVNYLGGLINANNGNYKQSAILLQKTMDINPHKVEDPMFMLQFGEVLLFAERFEDSKIVLEKCREWGWLPESYPTYQERVTELLTQIENM